MGAKGVGGPTALHALPSGALDALVPCASLWYLASAAVNAPRTSSRSTAIRGLGILVLGVPQEEVLGKSCLLGFGWTARSNPLQDVPSHALDGRTSFNCSSGKLPNF